MAVDIARAVALLLHRLGLRVEDLLRGHSKESFALLGSFGKKSIFLQSLVEYIAIGGRSVGEIIRAPSGASQRRIEANRMNAQASTGPKTQAGKDASSRNAIAHGLRARNILLAGEDRDDFVRLRVPVFAELEPRGVIESELAEQIVETLWRLRRIPLFERALFASLEQTERKDAFLSDVGLASKTPEQARDIKFGRVIERFLNGNFSGKLSRYETNLQRQLFRLLTELHKLKRQREIEMEAAPFVTGDLPGDRG
jgi:hypothetical protein